MLDSFTKKQKIIFFVILCIMMLFILYYIYATLYQNHFSPVLGDETTVLLDNNELVSNSLSNDLEFHQNTDENTIIVYICGAVKESKVISLKEDSRIADAIEAVGGLNQDADLTNINLAYILEDGEKIYIPKKGEEVENNASTASIAPASTSSQSTKVNINKASQTELETIPGVGPSTALKIIHYRTENGKFTTIEDIKNVSGIGDAKYENMKNYICVK